MLASCAPESPAPEVQGMPDYLAQALALRTQLTTQHRPGPGRPALRQLQQEDIARLQATTLVFEDVDGEPFLQLTAVAPHRPSFHSVEKLPSREEQSDSGLYFTTLTGAREDTVQVSAHARTLERFVDLAAAVERVGGASKVRRYVAFAPHHLAVEGRDGRTFSLLTGEFLGAEALAELTGEARAVKQRVRQDSRLVTELSKGWEETRGVTAPEKPGVERADFALSSLRTQEGGLDFVAAASVLSRERIPVRRDGERQAQREWHTQICYWWGCGPDSYQGDMGSRFVVSGGFAQFSSNYSLGGGNWNVPDCSNGAPHAGAVLGCAPSSFLSLVYWLWRYDGTGFFNFPIRIWPYSPYPAPIYDWSTVNGPWTTVDVLSPMSRLARGGPNSRAVIQNYFDTCFFINGGFTYPWKFREGMDRFFADHSATYGIPRYTVRGVTRGAVNPVDWFPEANASHEMANLVRGRVGRNDGLERLVIALYPVDKGGTESPVAAFKALHYAPIWSYFVEYSWGRANLQVATVEDYTKWFNITDPYVAFSGVYTADKP
jgi:hypothetical protein